MSLDNISVRRGWTQVSGQDDGTTRSGYGFGGRAGIAAGTEGGAPFSSVIPVTGATPSIANGGTFTHNGAGAMRVTTGGAVTGAIVQAGVIDGQVLRLINISTNTITMALAGTSNVANGTSAVIAATAAMTLVWNAADARWYVA